MLYRIKRGRQGFTLIELLTSVVIVGVLASVALPNFLNFSDRARTTEGTASLDAIKSAQQAYLSTEGTYATVGNVATGNCYPSVRLGASGGIVRAAGAPSDFATLLGVTIDPTLNGRWRFATRRSLNGSGVYLKLAAEGLVGSIRGMGIYYDSSPGNGDDVGKLVLDADPRNQQAVSCS